MSKCMECKHSSTSSKSKPCRDCIYCGGAENLFESALQDVLGDSKGLLLARAIYDAKKLERSFARALCAWGTASVPSAPVEEAVPIVPAIRVCAINSCRDAAAADSSLCGRHRGEAVAGLEPAAPALRSCRDCLRGEAPLSSCHGCGPELSKFMPRVPFSVEVVADEVRLELKAADAKYGPMPTILRGLKTIHCEYQELAAEVEGGERDTAAARKECVQLAAMCFKLIRLIDEGAEL